jgi:hypothetical protein
MLDRESWIIAGVIGVVLLAGLFGYVLAQVTG